ncbi:hypothetical protein SAMN05444004_10229 [Jannaschia faecimaris]|uniref:Uncharacterized protein n=1 Tax=Jannaschia faecimaris TaxID=1244108 RepID=A0A1H3KYY8_9RHOB|nr:hypothetical protein [Jannaschia faecimaris]SDY57199.1 hypothetical protein SAMN05444004_10229 [Jannaschia faecimaris]
MPGPDPQGLQIEEHDGGGFTVSAAVWLESNRRAHRPHGGRGPQHEAQWLVLRLVPCAYPALSPG